jgi:hypothetical protein
MTLSIDQLDTSDAIAARASFPDIISAIRASGDRNGSRVTIDIPELDMDAVKRLLDLRGKMFYVVFVPVTTDEDAAEDEDDADQPAAVIIRSSSAKSRRIAPED